MSTTSGRRVASAKEAVEIIREYARASPQSMYWKDVLECVYDSQGDEWHVKYEASPSALSPYYRYEAVVDGKSGDVKSVRRLET